MNTDKPQLSPEPATDEQSQGTDRAAAVEQERAVAAGEAISRSWLHRRLIAPLKRLHPGFRILDIIRIRLAMQDRQAREFAAMQNAMLLMAKQHKDMAMFLADARQRLLHHENGPLQASKRELDRRRKDGMVRPIDAKRNGAKSKTIDAAGNVREVDPE